jgi:hypothetical protein
VAEVDELFFRGFLASLRLRHQEFVDTRENLHHERFREVAAQLERAHREGRAGADELPRLFRPTMATGLYGELDDALLELQEGYGSSPNPTYPGLKLVLTEDRAKDALDEFSPEARALLDDLARAFIESRPSTRSQLPEYA